MDISLLFYNELLQLPSFNFLLFADWESGEGKQREILRKWYSFVVGCMILLKSCMLPNPAWFVIV